MPELVEQMYCSQQIVIPPSFPYILKRYCKAAIKTQPYDMLRWSFEYFKALAAHKPPPVKLRLEYPIYSTEGGLTRGCLKVLAQQLSPMVDIPLPVVKIAWQGFCLDPVELRRIFCLCEVYMKEEVVPFLHFIAVAGGLLTKCLTHTMILLCESLTKEPDGGSAAIPIKDFLVMYKFLARIDASQDVQYHNGHREGLPEPELIVGEEEGECCHQDIAGHHKKLRELSSLKMASMGKMTEDEGPAKEEKKVVQEEKVENKMPKIVVYDPDEQQVAYDIFGEPIEGEEDQEQADEEKPDELEISKDMAEEDRSSELHLADPADGEANKLAAFLSKIQSDKEERIEDLLQTFDEIAAIVDHFNSTNYDLGMIAGRQMSTTSGEFIVQHIQKEIMDYINDQIAILPDPDLKKKKAKPEEVAMIRELLQDFIEENISIIVPDVEEVEEEEQPIPEITVVYAVPGIGGPVDEEIIETFEDYMFEVSKTQADMAMPRNIRHFLCPPLEKFVEHDYEDLNPAEQVATGGVIID